MGDSKKKKCTYKAGDKNCSLCMEEKLAVDSYINPDELLSQRLELLKVHRHKKRWLLGR